MLISFLLWVARKYNNTYNTATDNALKSVHFFGVFSDVMLSDDAEVSSKIKFRYHITIKSKTYSMSFLWLLFTQNIVIGKLVVKITWFRQYYDI